MKKAILITTLILLTIGVAGFFYLKGKRYEIVITQEQIDAALEEKFPHSKEFLLIFEITYSNPRVNLLEESDRIQVGMDAVLITKLGKEPKQLAGSCAITAGLDYDHEEQAFYLTDTEFEKLEIEGVPAKHLDKVTEATGSIAKKLLDHLPVYRLEAKDKKTRVAKLLLRDFEIQGQQIFVSLGL